jgi:hypothetical protein
MSWRIAEHVMRGEIDNRLPGIIKGTLYLDYGPSDRARDSLRVACDRGGVEATPLVAGTGLRTRRFSQPHGVGAA